MMNLKTFKKLIRNNDPELMFNVNYETIELSVADGDDAEVLARISLKNVDHPLIVKLDPQALSGEVIDLIANFAQQTKAQMFDEPVARTLKLTDQQVRELHGLINRHTSNGLKAALDQLMKGLN